MNIPYTTKSGVKIGIYYQKPRYVEEDLDMLRLQSFLIHDPDRLKRDYWVNRIPCSPIVKFKGGILSLAPPKLIMLSFRLLWDNRLITPIRFD